jgi:transposase
LEDPGGRQYIGSGAQSGRWRKRGTLKEGFGRSRGGFTSKIHARCDGDGRPLAIQITGGEASDSKQLSPLMAIDVGLPAPKHLLADAGYDGDANRAELLICSIRPVIRPNPTRKNMPSLDKTMFRLRNKIERMFNKLKQMRRIAIRYEKTESSFRGLVTLAAIRLWLPTFVHSA